MENVPNFGGVAKKVECPMRFFICNCHICGTVLTILVVLSQEI